MTPGNRNHSDIPADAPLPSTTVDANPPGKDASLIVFLVGAALFMENLDGTVISTALPQMARSFALLPIDLSIGMSSYLLTLTVFILNSGWVADRFGVRNVFTAALAIFTVASIACGMTNGLAEFTAARIVQGIGGAMMVPVGRLAVLRVTSKQNLMRAISFITWPGLVAPMIGPPLGGFITTYSSWRWIFFLNLPLGLIGMLLAWRSIRPGGESLKRRFDAPGFFLCGIACTTLMYAMELMGRNDVKWLQASAYLLAAVISGGFALYHLPRTAHPVLALSAFRVKTFTVAMVGGTVFRGSISAVPFLLPLMFQVGFGMNALRSGLLTLAVFAGNLAMKVVTTPIIRRFGFRSVLLVNGTLAGVSLGAIGLVGPATPVLWVLIILFISGVTRSLQFTAINTLSFADVPQAEMSGASTLSSMLNQMAAGMGVALGAIALRVAAALHGHSAHTLSNADFGLAFVMVGVVGLVSLADVIGLHKMAGAAVSGYKPR